MRLFSGTNILPEDITAELLMCKNDFSLREFFSDNTPNGADMITVITPTQCIGLAFDGEKKNHLHILKYLLKRLYANGTEYDNYWEAFSQSSKSMIIMCGYKNNDEYGMVLHLNNKGRITLNQLDCCRNCLEQIESSQHGSKLEIWMNDSFTIPELKKMLDRLKKRKDIRERSISLLRESKELDWEEFDFSGCNTPEEIEIRAREYAIILKAKMERLSTKKPKAGYLPSQGSEPDEDRKINVFWTSYTRPKYFI